jgi:hypothetical protein
MSAALRAEGMVVVYSMVENCQVEKCAGIMYFNYSGACGYSLSIFAPESVVAIDARYSRDLR